MASHPPSREDARAASAAAVAEPGASANASWFARLLVHPRLALYLALVAGLLTAPSLFIGFHLDDYVHRYLLSDLPGADALERAYESPFGIANGDPAVNHWQIEEGYAPWWIEPTLLVSLYRPVSELSHRIDAALFPHSAVLQHAHNVLWYAALAFVVTLLFTALHGRTTVAGLAALLYAIDHTHGFAVGWIANRNAVIAACLGCLALLLHHLGRSQRALLPAIAAPLALLGALLSGEGAIAVFGFVVAYALLLDRARPLPRVLAVLPHLAVVLAWRVLYTLNDRGAHGSGLYLDPAREPLAFARAALERVPVLLLGELGLPPAEAFVFLPEPWPRLQLALAVLVALWLLVASFPLVRRDRLAAFWLLGTAGALLPAVSTHPNNRLLFFVGLGCAALASQLWHALLEQAAWLPKSTAWRAAAASFSALVVGFHLLISPLLLPLTTVSVAATAPARQATDAILDAAGDGQRDVVVLSAPDYYYTKLARPVAALEGRAAPRQLRVLSFGAVPLIVTRLDARTLELAFEGGLLREPLLELYRARSSPLPVGMRVELRGLRIEVTALTPDGFVARVRCAFDQDLDAQSTRFVAWQDGALRPFAVPAIGMRSELPAAAVRFGF